MKIKMTPKLDGLCIEYLNEGYFYGYPFLSCMTEYMIYDIVLEVIENESNTDD